MRFRRREIVASDGEGVVSQRQPASGVLRIQRDCLLTGSEGRFDFAPLAQHAGAPAEHVGFARFQIDRAPAVGGDLGHGREGAAGQVAACRVAAGVLWVEPDGAVRRGQREGGRAVLIDPDLVTVGERERVDVREPGVRVGVDGVQCQRLAEGGASASQARRRAAAE